MSWCSVSVHWHGESSISATSSNLCVWWVHTAQTEVVHLIGVSLKIRTSFVAMARMWKDLPRFGANAISWTASVTVISVSALAYFLCKTKGKKIKQLLDLQNFILVYFKSTYTTLQTYVPCVFIVLIDLNLATICCVAVVTPYCKHWWVGTRAGCKGEKTLDIISHTQGWIQKICGVKRWFWVRSQRAGWKLDQGLIGSTTLLRVTMFSKTHKSTTKWMQVKSSKDNSMLREAV